MKPCGWFPRSARPSMRPPRAYPRSRSTARFTSSNTSARGRAPSRTFGKSIAPSTVAHGLNVWPPFVSGHGATSRSNLEIPGHDCDGGRSPAMDPLLFILLAVALGFKHSYDADHLVAPSRFPDGGHVLPHT